MLRYICRVLGKNCGKTAKKPILKQETDRNKGLKMYANYISQRTKQGKKQNMKL